MEESKMKKHVTVVGALHIGFGILGLIGALAAFFALRFAMGVVGSEEIPATVLSFLSISVPLLIGFMSTLGLVGGIALFSYKNWARILVLIIAAMGCLNIPIGTLKGVYSIWVLMQDETAKLFEK
jgi:polyferredoxin